MLKEDLMNDLKSAMNGNIKEEQQNVAEEYQV